MKMFPSKIEKQYAQVILSFCLGATISAFAVSKDLYLKELIGLFGALLAAFFGAYFAFRLSEKRAEKRAHEEMREAFNFALFVLVRQINAVKVIKRNISKYKDEIELAFNMPGYMNASYEDLKQNVESLSFILSSGEPNLLMELTVEQERFEQAL